MVDSELLEYVAMLPGMPNSTQEMKGSKMRTSHVFVDVDSVGVKEVQLELEAFAFLIQM